MKRIIAACLALVMIFALASCAGGAGGGEAEGPLGVSEIIIGYVGPITGPFAGLGLPIHEGARWAIETINENGGIMGVPIRYEFRDDQGDPTRSATYVRELVDRIGIHMLIGSPNSPSVSAVLDFLTENRIVTFLNSASAGALVNHETYPYMFRTQVTNAIMAQGLIRDAQRVGFERVVLLGDNGTVGTDGIAALREYAALVGFEYLDVIQYAPGTVDMTPVAQAVARNNPDAILSFSLGEDAARVVSALDRVGLTGTLSFLGYMGTFVPNFVDLVGEGPAQFVTYQAVNAMSVPDGMYPPHLGHAQVFYDRVQDELGPFGLGERDYDWFGMGRVYDVVQIMRHIIETAGSLDPGALRDAVHGITDFPSVIYETGYNFSPTNHEGFNPDWLANCYLDRFIINEGYIRTEAVGVRTTRFD